MITERKKYNVIYADPPWSYKSKSGRDMLHGSEMKYTTMTNEDIAAMPLVELLDRECSLFYVGYCSVITRRIGNVISLGI